MKTRNMKAVYPKDWVKGRPYQTPDSADRYYAGLATKVMGVLRRSCISDAFSEDIDQFEAAKCLTGWFEDLCSDTGIWRVANEEFRRRYGAVLPFYDVTEYYEGEPNVQDLQLLLWHLIQTLCGSEEGRLINPENPGIAMVAEDLCRLFGEEYETAPANTRLYDFIHSPELATDWWACRNLMHWFALECFINPYKCSMIEDEVFDEMEDDEEFDNMKGPLLFYELTLRSSFGDRDNLLSMTAPQWCGRITGVDDLLSCKRLPSTVYLYQGRDDSHFWLLDEDQGTRYEVENDSVEDIQAIDRLKKDESRVYISLTTFGKRVYLCGSLLNVDDAEMQENMRKPAREARFAKEAALKVKDRFFKASGDAPMIFCKDFDEALRFVEKKMGVKKGDVSFDDLEDDLKGCVTVMCDDEHGLMLMGELARCIASPDNPYYDQAFAETNALNLFVNSDVVSYPVACQLYDKGYLKDASMNSMLGLEYGREFIRHYGQFFLDYFHERYRGDGGE